MTDNKVKLSQLCEMVEGRLRGDEDPFISGVNDIDLACETEISFLAKKAQVARLSGTRAAAVVAPLNTDTGDIPAILVNDPYLAIAVIHNYFEKHVFVANGIADSAVVGMECRIPEEASIGPYCVLGDRVTVGKRVRLHAGVVIGHDVTIGDDCIIHPNVTVYPRTKIGNRVICHGGAVIGSDGYGYAVDKNGNHVKRPHIGYVQLDDDVEIGANTCIDRGTFGRTWIKKGVKIDNLVQIAHNVEIGENSLIVAQVGISGSTKLGRQVVLGGKVGVSGHLVLGDGVMAAAKSGIAGNVKDGDIVGGFPAIAKEKWLRASIIFSRLPELLKDIKYLKKKITELEVKKDEV